jgi:hypothetical protein
MALLASAPCATGETATPPYLPVAGVLVFEFNDSDVQHDMGCGGTGRCLVAELMEIASPGGVFLGTAREEVYEITPKTGIAGAHVRARLFFTIVDASGAEVGRLETGEFIVDGAMTETLPATGQTKFNTRWDGTVRGISGIYAGKSGRMHMRGYNITHRDAATGVTLVDQFYNTYVMSGFQ